MRFGAAPDTVVSRTESAAMPDERERGSMTSGDPWFLIRWNRRFFFALPLANSVPALRAVLSGLELTELGLLVAPVRQECLRAVSVSCRSPQRPVSSLPTAFRCRC